MTNSNEQLQAVIVAGGFGRRLLPLTERTPKPMLPMDRQPLLESLVKQISAAGISTIRIATHFKADRITEYFGDGSRHGVQISYLHESQPLGTAGFLQSLPRSSQSVLVINGDILTDLDLGRFIQFHLQQKPSMTIAVKDIEIPVEFGVLTTEGPLVTGFLEKPVHHCLINAGIYILSPAACRWAASGSGPLGMADVIAGLIAEGAKVVSYQIEGNWIDIGTHKDYEKARTFCREFAAMPLSGNLHHVSSGWIGG